MKKTMIGLTLLVLALMSACTRQVGWVGMNYGNVYNASYILFDGKQTETLNLKAGETLNLAYHVSIDSGALTFQLIDPDRRIEWEASFRDNIKDFLSYPVDSSGRYTLRLIGDETSGKIDLRWEIEN
jgi:hypothetical protein